MRQARRGSQLAVLRPLCSDRRSSQPITSELL